MSQNFWILKKVSGNLSEPKIKLPRAGINAANPQTKSNYAYCLWYRFTTKIEPDLFLSELHKSAMNSLEINCRNVYLYEINHFSKYRPFAFMHFFKRTGNRSIAACKCITNSHAYSTPLCLLNLSDCASDIDPDCFNN